jgi:hypothetical protein
MSPTTSTVDGARSQRNLLGSALLWGQAVLTAFMVVRQLPTGLREPATWAAVASLATSLAVGWARLRGHRGSSLERRLWAAFLAVMPLVYLASWLLARQPGWLPVELAGVVLFGALALAGLRRSPWFLAGGIAAHGLLWDSWHHGRADFIPDWYVLGCLAIDLMLGAYLALEMPHFRTARRP